MDIKDYVNDSSSNNDNIEQYNQIIEELQNLKESNVPIQEGLFKAVLGGIAGMIFMPSLMGFICECSWN